MRLLALDSATSACSAAVWQDGRLIAHRHRPMARGQSEALIPMVAEVMAEAGLAFADLDLLAVTVGPGTFTGIRIGLAAARGLGLASGRPVTGIPTTDAVAAAVPATERAGRTVLVAMDSKREEIWAQAFAPDLTPLSPAQALLPEEAAGLIDGPVVVVGDATDRVVPLLAEGIASSAPGWPDAAIIASLAASRWPKGRTLPAEPLYLRPADVTLPPACPA